MLLTGSLETTTKKKDYCLFSVIFSVFLSGVYTRNWGGCRELGQAGAGWQQVCSPMARTAWLQPLICLHPTACLYLTACLYPIACLHLIACLHPKAPFHSMVAGCRCQYYFIPWVIAIMLHAGSVPGPLTETGEMGFIQWDTTRACALLETQHLGS